MNIVPIKEIKGVHPSSEELVVKTTKYTEGRSLTEIFQGKDVVRRIYKIAVGRANPETIEVPRYIFEGKFSAEDIPKIKNVEVRRAAIELYGGYDMLLNELPHKVLNTWGDYELIKFKDLKDEEKIVLLKVKDTSTGIFYTLRVPPNTKKVKEAVAWTFDMDAEQYFENLVEET